MKVIVVDPGHGGADHVGGSSPNNATSVSGNLEKDISLDVAKRIRQHILSKQVANCILTREDDSNLGLNDRATIAAANEASVFLSVHCNGFSDSAVRGTECWIDRKYNKPAMLMVAGGSRSMPGPGVPNSGARNVNVDRDAEFASAVVEATLSALKESDKGAKLRSDRYTKKNHGEAYRPPKGVKMMGLGVLKDAQLGTSENDCVAALLELEFITNPKADKLFNGANSDVLRDRLAEYIGNALLKYV